MAGPALEPIVIARQRPLVAAQGTQDIAAIEMRLGKVGIGGERLRATLQRFLAAAEVQEHRTAPVERLGIVRCNDSAR